MSASGSITEALLSSVKLIRLEEHSPSIGPKVSKGELQPSPFAVST